MSGSNCCFLACIQISQEAGQMVWYSHLCKNFPQFVVIHTVKGFGVVHKAKVDVFLERLLFRWCMAAISDLPLEGITAAVAAAAKSLQSCPTLCDPIDGSPPGSAVPGFLQARSLEWVVISFSNAWKWKTKVKSLSRVWLFTTPWTATYQAPLSMWFPGKSTGVGFHCLSHEIYLLLLYWLHKSLCLCGSQQTVENT